MGTATVDSQLLKSKEKQSDETNLLKAMRARVIECENFVLKVVCEIVWFYEVQFF